MTQLLLRNLKNEDIPFITNSWLKSYRNSNAVKGMSNTNYYKVYHDLVHLHLKEDKTIVAVMENDDNQIIGYVNFNDKGVNFVYVKHVFRQMGVANILLNDEEITKPLKGHYHTYSWDTYIEKI